MSKRVGRWYRLVCGGIYGEVTNLGVAAYDIEADKLEFAIYSPSMDRAIRRGDWSDEWMQLGPPADHYPFPGTHTELESRLASMGNAMSHIRYEGGLGCVLSDGDEPEGHARYERMFAKHVPDYEAVS